MTERKQAFIGGFGANLMFYQQKDFVMLQPQQVLEHEEHAKDKAFDLERN